MIFCKKKYCIMLRIAWGEVFVAADSSSSWNKMSMASKVCSMSNDAKTLTPRDRIVASEEHSIAE